MSERSGADGSPPAPHAAVAAAPAPHPAPTRIVTERLVVRQPRPQDDAVQAFAVIDAERDRLHRWLPWVPNIRTAGDEQAFLDRVVGWWEAHEQFHWLVFERDTYAFVGSVGTARVAWDQGLVELGYWIAQAYEGQGLVTEAVRGVQRACFAMGFHRVEIRCSSGNTRSAAIPKRLGYQLDAQLREERIEHGARVDTLVYSLLRTDNAAEPGTDPPRGLRVSDAGRRQPRIRRIICQPEPRQRGDDRRRGP